MKIYSSLFFLFLFSFSLFAQSTSNNPDAAKTVTNQDSRVTPNTVTFTPGSGIALGDLITTQYVTEGVSFNNCRIETDGANPSSPVLSGPYDINGDPFKRAIVGTFVVPPVPGTPATVKEFSFDAGYFDQVGSTELTWIEADGTVNTQLNTSTGIENFSVTSTVGILKFTIKSVSTEDAGFAIDNLYMGDRCVANSTLDFSSIAVPNPVYETGVSIVANGVVTSDVALKSNTICIGEPDSSNPGNFIPFEVQVPSIFCAIIEACP